MNVGEEYAYYYCYERECKLCDGYSYLNSPVDGCLVVKKQQEAINKQRKKNVKNKVISKMKSLKPQ